MTYPNAVPEFRILVRANGQQVMQVRYVHQGMGYVGKWQDVPVVKEDDTSNSA